MPGGSRSTDGYLRGPNRGMDLSLAAHRATSLLCNPSSANERAVGFDHVRLSDPEMLQQGGRHVVDGSHPAHTVFRMRKINGYARLNRVAHQARVGKPWAATRRPKCGE